ncbi:hypothetical protein DAEQUDRAFT_767951 [Daedalea quercina L-15889]|uniref:MYND-type domain-containing protein n=1 Tax=Daedalea quercina L-15889 TaxID=1314783 RepID=A0A165N415_9APHY|nr:hypothetical protein DAEQUDRAFT_767951 [Daedalea quercina L-15889]
MAGSVPFNDPQTALNVASRRIAGAAQGRSLHELLQTDDPLSGVESQRLRSFFTSECMEPARDLEPYGAAIFSGDLASVMKEFFSRVSRNRASSGSEEDARKAVAQEIYMLSWGPTCVARFLIYEAKVPVNGVDLSGSQAIYHCVSTKPAFDPELAQILYDAGGDVSARSRYGGTAAHEIALVYDWFDRAKMQCSADAPKWFLDHGGDVDIKDNGGTTARGCIEAIRQKVVNGARANFRLPMWDVLDREDRRRQQLADGTCTFCGRDDARLLKCSQCMKAQYRSPPRTCQRADWSKHKSPCKTSRGQRVSPATYIAVVARQYRLDVPRIRTVATSFL